MKSHGGPTTATDSALNLSVQFWTSRGFGVLDVNYRGSTGYGRKYRERLYGQWGVIDVVDCISGAKFLAARADVDGGKLAITGGSAGGYTTLCGLTFHTEFAVGASYYGVPVIWSRSPPRTHKFELHYTDWLIEPFRPNSALYHDRSPINFTDRLSAPVIFLHGKDDPVVPINQAQRVCTPRFNAEISRPVCLYSRTRSTDFVSPHIFAKPLKRSFCLFHEPDTGSAYIVISGQSIAPLGATHFQMKTLKNVGTERRYTSWPTT